jgi:hypothetical protein
MIKHVAGAVALVLVLVLAAIMVLVLTPGTPFSLAVSPPQLHNSCGFVGGSQGGDGGLKFCLTFLDEDANGYYTSSYNPNGYSSTIAFGVHVTSTGPCTQNPAWVTSTAAGYFGAGNGQYSAVNQQQNTQLKLFVDTSGGTPEVIGPSGSQTYVLTWNFNSSAGYLTPSAFCSSSIPGSQSDNSVYLSQNLSFQGTFQDFSVITVLLSSQGALCDGSNYGSQAATQETANAGAICEPSATYGLTSGGTVLPINAMSQAILRSGYTSLSPPTAGYCLNGQGCPVGYTTGYDTGAGYTIEMLYPQGRSNGGQIALGPYSLPSLSVGTYTFQIPNGFSISCGTSNPSCDQFQVWIFSNLFPAAAIYRLGIDINQASVPGIPSVTATDVQGNSPAHQGDTEQLALSASSGNVTSFNVAGYYNAGESVPPVSSQYWIDSQPLGQQVTASPGPGGSASASFSFVIAFVATTTVIVQDINSAGQSNQITINIEVIPSNCQTPSCQQPQANVWVISVLAVVVIALAVALLLLFVPLPWTVRIVVIIAAAIGAFVIADWLVPFLFGLGPYALSLGVPGNIVGGWGAL